MTHLTHKLAVSLLITSVILPSVIARDPLLEIPSVISPASAVPQTLNPNEHQDPNSPTGILKRLHDGEAQIEMAVLRGADVQKERFRFKKIYKKLMEEYKELKAAFEALSDSEKQLKIENAALKTEQEKYQNEKKSTWQRFKNWVFNLDVTKVTTTLITGLITVISTLLIILL